MIMGRDFYSIQAIKRHEQEQRQEEFEQLHKKLDESKMKDVTPKKREHALSIK